MLFFITPNTNSSILEAQFKMARVLSPQRKYNLKFSKIYAIIYIENERKERKGKIYGLLHKL